MREESLRAMLTTCRRVIWAELTPHRLKGYLFFFFPDGGGKSLYNLSFRKIIKVTFTRDGLMAMVFLHKEMRGHADSRNEV